MKSQSNIRNALKDRRKELGLTLKDVAKIVGVSEATVSRWESGDIANMRRDRIAKLAKALQISPAVIMGWEHVSPSPVYEAAAGPGRIGDGTPTDEVKGIMLEADQVFVTVHGKSMEPTLYDGDLVIVQATNVVDGMDQIALVKINGDMATLKRVEVKADGITLIGDNVAEYKPHFYTAREVQELPVTIEGVVVKLVRDL